MYSSISRSSVEPRVGEVDIHHPAIGGAHPTLDQALTLQPFQPLRNPARREHEQPSQLRWRARVRLPERRRATSRSSVLALTPCLRRTRALRNSACWSARRSGSETRRLPVGISGRSLSQSPIRASTSASRLVDCRPGCTSEITNPTLGGGKLSGPDGHRRLQRGNRRLHQPVSLVSAANAAPLTPTAGSSRSTAPASR